MKCTKCGAELPAKARFCMMCGAAVPEEKAHTTWSDDHVEVTFDSIRAAKKDYAFCFRFKNHSDRNIVAIMYSLTVGGKSLMKDRLMSLLEGQDKDEEVGDLFFGSMEIRPGGEAVCFASVSREQCVLDPQNMPPMKCSPGYCLQGEGGYNYGADQYNLPEKSFTI